MGGAAPGAGESLRGAAAPSTNRKVQRRGADQSGVKGRAGRAQPGVRSLVPALPWAKLGVSRVAATAVASGS